MGTIPTPAIRGLYPWFMGEHLFNRGGLVGQEPAVIGMAHTVAAGEHRLRLVEAGRGRKKKSTPTARNARESGSPNEFSAVRGAREKSAVPAKLSAPSAGESAA